MGLSGYTLHGHVHLMDFILKARGFLQIGIFAWQRYILVNFHFEVNVQGLKKGYRYLLLMAIFVNLKLLRFHIYSEQNRKRNII